MSNDVDDLIDDNDAEAKPAKSKAKAKPVKSKAEAKPVKSKAAPAKKAAAAKKVAKGKDKAEAKVEKRGRPEGSDTTPIKQALAKVKKPISYADFTEQHGFNIRSVRRVARGMRDAGEIDLQKEGTVVYIAPAV